MANRGPNLNQSQFYITFDEQPHLDRINTVFGRVIDGLDTLTSIENFPVDDKHRPIPAVHIASAPVPMVECVEIHANPIAEAD